MPLVPLVPHPGASAIGVALALIEGWRIAMTRRPRPAMS